MEIKTLLVLIITALMISSGLAILADSNPSDGSSQAAVLPMSPAQSFTLTFVANGLTNLFSGSDSWFIDYFNTSNVGGLYPLYPTSNSVSTTVLAGTYYYQAEDYFQNLYESSNSPVITVNSNTIVYVNFSTPQAITFHEQGLNSTYKWGVDMSGSAPVYTSANNVSGGSPITYYTIDGNFQYSWFESQNGINTTLGTSSTFVGTTNISISIPISSFSNVTFTEKNLPSGTTWFVEQMAGPDANGSYLQGTTSSLTMRVMDGMNTFSAGYKLNSFKINLTYVTVSVGSVDNVRVDFPSLYQVNFSSSNLPASMYYYDWGMSVSFNYGPFYDSFGVTNTSSPNISLLLPDTVLREVPFIDLNSNAGGSISGYTVLSDPIYLAISQSNQKQAIHFGTLYQVTLNFIGMPSADYLIVDSEFGNINTFAYSRNTPSAALLAPNGTFSFTYGVGTTGSYGSALNVPFNFTVNGAGSSLNFQLYYVNFTNAYGPSGFSLTVDSPHQINTGYVTYFYGTAGTGQSVDTLLINGSYSYTFNSNLSGESDLYISSLAQFNVSGADQTIMAQIPTEYYNTTFDALGLPSGASFSLHLKLVSSSLTLNYFTTLKSSNSYIYLPFGEYYVNGLESQFDGHNYFANGTYLNVSAASTLHFAFSSNAYLNITETGLPSGTTWSLVFNGTTYSTSSTSILVSGNAEQVLNFSINPVGSYYPDPSSGNFYPLFGGYYFGSGTLYKVLPVIFTPKMLVGQSNPVSTINVTSMALGKGAQLNLSSTSLADTITTDSSNGMTYITYSVESDYNGPRLLVVNSSSYAVVARLSLGTGGIPLYAALDQADGMLYVAISVSPGSGESYYIATVNTANNAVQITPVNIPSLSALLVDQKTSMLYAASANAIYCINPATMSIVATVLMNGTYADINYGGGIDLQYSVQTGFIYATGYIPNGVVAIDPATNSVYANYTFAIETNPMNSYVGSSTLDQQGGILYYTLQQYYGSTNQYISSIIAFNIQTGKFQVGPVLGQGFAVNIAFDAANGYVYIPLELVFDFSSPLSSLGLGQLIIYDPSNGLLINSTELANDPYTIAIDPSNNDVLVSNYYSGSVSIVGHSTYGYISGTVSTSSAEVSINGITVPVVNGHYAVAVAPGTYYVSAFADGYSPVVQNVAVKEFSTTNVSLMLNSATSSYEVSGKVSVAGASVLFDGISAAVNSTGNYQIYVSPGKYTVSVFKSGYFPLSENVDVTSNTVLNLSLTKEPAPNTIVNNGNVSAQGFNVTVSSVILGTNGTVTLQFTATANGILTVEVPFTDLPNTNITDLLHSRVYINGVQYSNFSITISSNYSIILKVMGLNGDPDLVWAFTPNYVAPPPNAPNYQTLFLVGAIVAAIVILGAVGVYMVKRRKRQ